MKRILAALAVVLASGCTVARSAHTPQLQTNTSQPEPDPACRGNLAQCLTVTGLEQVVVKVGVSAEGRIEFVDVLTPALTPQDAVEVRRALDGCAWKPAVGPNGERTAGSFTLAIHR